MNIQKTSSMNFKGYNARPLKGFLMCSNTHGIAEEMRLIGEKEGFKIFAISEDLCSEILPNRLSLNSDMWAQDIWTIVKSRLLSSMENPSTDSIKNFFNIVHDPTQANLRNNPKYRKVKIILEQLTNSLRDSDSTKVDPNLKDVFKVALEIEKQSNHLNNLAKKTHISGGNIYLIQDNTGTDLLIGENDFKDFSKKTLKNMYSADRIIPLPQMDYHLDLFIRPLKNKTILLTDDILSLDALEKGLEEIKSLDNINKKIIQHLTNNINLFKDSIRLNRRPQTGRIERILADNEYNVIRVPGRVYQTNDINNREVFLTHYCNYMNANVLRNKDGEIVYITNNSDIDRQFGIPNSLLKKINYSFEKEFYNSISPFVKKEHFYTIKGTKNFVAEQMLTDFQGGIHCVCTEIPEEL